MMTSLLNSSKHRRLIARLAVHCLLTFISFSLQAQPRLNTESATDFFNTLGGRLLQSEMGLDINHIQVYPTSQYTPAVHRLLQVTANIYDCTTNRTDLSDYPYLPTVFRPSFTNDNGTIYITGYTEETRTNINFTKPLDLRNPTERDALQSDANVYGIPLIIGAKKGFPNFNEFSMATVSELTRRMQVSKASQTDTFDKWKYNTQYSVSVSNIIAVEMWNSYSNAYPRAVQIFVTNEMTMVLTNELGVLQSNRFNIGSIAAINPNVWQGAAANLSDITQTKLSFSVPLWTNVAFVPLSILRYSPPGLTTNLNQSFEDNSGTNALRWGINVTNRLLVIIIDAQSGRLIGYVQFVELDDAIDLKRAMEADSIPSPSGTGISTRRIWDPTQQADSPQITKGMWQQIQMSLGNTAPQRADWLEYMINPPSGNAQNAEILKFQNFYAGTTNTLVAQVPFTPTARFSNYRTWQANDPLVHHLTTDLYDALRNSQLPKRFPLTQQVTLTSQLPNIQKVNDRFRPWSGSPVVSSDNDPHASDLAIKDPLIYRPDNWDFPNSASLSFDWIGRVHRGTPWQTIYLKSTGLPTNMFKDWEDWTGNKVRNYVTGLAEAPITHPTNDWHLASLFISLLNTNSPRELYSVNLGISEALATGLNVLTKTNESEFVLQVLQPDSPQAIEMLRGIDSARAAQAGGYFHNVEDILSTPELTVASPWLGLTGFPWESDISDAVFEMIPSQLLPLLRTDSIATPIANAGVFQISFSGYDGYPYSVETSTNLNNWISIGIYYPTNGTFLVTPPAEAESAQGYYRSALVPQD